MYQAKESHPTYRLAQSNDGFAHSIEHPNWLHKRALPQNRASQSHPTSGDGRTWKSESSADFAGAKITTALPSLADKQLFCLRERIEQSIQGSIQLFGRFVVAAGDFTPQLRDFVQPDFATTGDR